jgi:hypothetical protein
MSRKGVMKNKRIMVIRNIVYPFLLVLLFLSQGSLSGQSFSVTISSEGDTEVCLGDSVAAVLNFSGGRSPYTVVINDNEGEYLLLEKIKSPYTFYISPESDNTYYIASAVDNRGRKGSASGSVSVVVHQPTPVSIIMDRIAFLVTEPGYPLTSSPPGGTFAGNGVSGDTFYPAVATPVGSPHQISCIYVNQYECASEDSEEVFVFWGEAAVYLLSGDDTITAICDGSSTCTIKGSNEDNLPGTFELFRKDSVTSLPGHITDDDLTDNEATLWLDGLKGAFEIVYTCGMETLEISASTGFTVDHIGSIGIRDLPDSLCKNDDPCPLFPDIGFEDPFPTFTFSGPGVSGNQWDGFFLDPGDQGVTPGPSEIHLEYISSYGCGAETTGMVHVGFTPDVSFIPDQICLAEGGSNISFSNLTGQKDLIAEWIWDFGDPASGMNNSSNLENPGHFYAEPGFRTIVLGATTLEGCSARHEVDTLLADYPVADFTWNNDCYAEDQVTTFLAGPVSAYSDIDTLIWTFRSADGELLEVIGKGPAEPALDHSFSSVGLFDVTLLVENAAGCQGEITRRVELLPVHALANDDYLETFDGLVLGWSVASEESTESWNLGEPDFAGFQQAENDKAWYTDLPGQPENYLEHSWVRSPCFDLSGLNNPVIRLDIMKSFRPGIDGAVIQYQDQVGQGWETLGTIGDGLNWYNDSAIYLKPGGSSTGWGLALFEPDTTWVPASHSLGVLAGNPHVKFRLAVASSGSQEITPGVFSQGFAFDNFFIGEPLIRRSVLEYFTNASGDSMFSADSIVKRFAMEHAGTVIDLYYHMETPEDDPMNSNNPYPSSTRSFNYGVPVVPYAVLNGGVTPEYRFDLSPPPMELDDLPLIRSSLEAPLFDLSLSVDYQENRLEGNISVTCLGDAFDSYLLLYIVVIELEVTAYPYLNQGIPFRNVVLDMLPTTGILLGNNWKPGTTEETGFSWGYASYIEDVDDLCVVAFVQDRDINNRWILQAVAVPHPDYVGIPGKTDVNRPMHLYPNPARDYLHIDFGVRTGNEGELVVVDISGRVVMKTIIQQDTADQQIDISQLPEGMFVVLWRESGMVLGHAKLVRNP